jgi:hypothetical protein
MRVWASLRPLERGVRRPLSGRAGACILALFVSQSIAQPAAAQTKSFVISWLTQAVYSQDGDCPGGNEPSIDEMLRRMLVQLGKTPSEIDALMSKLNGGSFTAPIYDVLVNRGRVAGKPVNVYDSPTSVPDPHVHTVVGKFAPGFNLDGRGADSPDSFEDPDTHEKGVNNQYFRALGCFTTHRGVPPARPLHWSYVWSAQRVAMRAWLISVSGADLSRNADVTVTFDKALSPVMLDANGNTQRDQTFRIDPDPRSHNVFRGRIQDHVLTIVPASFHMVSDPLLMAGWDIRNTHLRLTMNPDGTLSGLLGGYQSWSQIYFMYGTGAWSYESMVGLNIPGIYYALRRLADADPDPKTGQNMSISVAYRIEAVPAMTVPSNGGAQVVSTAVAPAGNR